MQRLNDNSDNNNDDDDDVDGGNRSGKWEGHSAGGLISPPLPHVAKAWQPSAVCGGSPGGWGVKYATCPKSETFYREPLRTPD